MSPLVEEHLIKVLHRELENYDILYMKDMLLTVLKELINNAVKANAKRLFFRKKGWIYAKRKNTATAWRPSRRRSSRTNRRF